MPTLRTDGAVVAYTDTGVPQGRDDAPTVVFGHGLLYSGWMFSAQIEALQSTYRCIAIDWRGQGASPPAEDGRYDMDTLYGDAVAVIEHIGVGPVHYVGLSMGGFVGMRVGARRPDLLRSLVLIETSADREERVAAIQDKVLTVVYMTVGIGPVRRSVEKIMIGPAFRKDPASRPVVQEWMRQIDQTDRRGLRGAILGVANRKAIAPEIGAITAPTLVICGVDDKPTPVKKARKIAAAIPGARLELVPDAGHSSTIERPEALTALIEKFLAEVD
ncbi:MAG TPA: alpha/beta fold hydrolase [Jatrophihabitantaceae bacterium]|nr:alpha/beta fold hydrolase [Jatrophihabitantaceae bacterium]